MGLLEDLKELVVKYDVSEEVAAVAPEVPAEVAPAESTVEAAEEVPAQ